MSRRRAATVAAERDLAREAQHAGPGGYMRRLRERLAQLGGTPEAIRQALLAEQPVKFPHQPEPS